MPIHKVPIVHKFGIISQSQRLELQERLLKQSYEKKYASQNLNSTSKNPLEICEEFVIQFNATEDLDELEKLEETAQKMLERVKRRVGLKDAGKGTHVDLPVAWTELSQLAQCKGKTQEDCLDVLITSLDQAPLAKTQIPALFYLAETCLYWLRTDAVNQPYLRTAELKILRMGYLVFIRLFYHHMAGHLQRHEEFKSRLYTYLDGFSDCQEAYNPYSNALLYVRYINEVGKMIIGLANLDPGEIKEGDAMPQDSQLFHEVSVTYDGAVSSQSGAISSSVHDLSPTLWHALDVWRCTNQLSAGLTDALNALSCCAAGLAVESWVDVICALHILTDAAKTKISVLEVLQDLARGIQPKQTDIQADPDTRAQTATSMKTSSFLESKGLSDIYEKTEEGSVREEEAPGPSRRSSRPVEPDNEARINTGWRAEVGSAASEASSVHSYANKVDNSTVGLQGWHWEVAITYVDLLADVVLHGSTSAIQKRALIGNNKSTNGIQSRPLQSPMKSAGLLDLVYFKMPTTNEATDWSWRVRYAALQSLVRVCKCCAGDATKEGMHTLAWNTLLSINKWEKDTRVLEALKVGQVEASIEKAMSSVIQLLPSAVGGKVAAGLAQLYLPPLPPPVDTPQPKKHHKPIVSPPKPYKKKPLRTTLKDEINLATALYEPPVSFNDRTNFDLHRLLEDQLRKDLQNEFDEEEKVRQKQLEQEQIEQEEKEKKAQESRKTKLANKYNNKKPYELTKNIAKQSEH